MSLKNLIGQPKVRQWIDTSKWAIQPTKGETFRIESHTFMCYRTFSHYARISWERKL